MKSFLILLLASACFACNDSDSNRPRLAKADDSSHVATVVDIPTIEAAKTGTVFISMEEGDTLWYTREELDIIKKRIIKSENGRMLSPDESYGQNEMIRFNDSSGRANAISFVSEVGADSYYQLYGYFLRKVNGSSRYKQRRKNTIDLFRSINEIFQILRHGGTYFGHQYRRIHGYAEYSVYEYANTKSYSSEQFGIAKRKKLFLDSLKEIIQEGLEENYGSTVRDQWVSEKRELGVLMNKLNKLITDEFYLENAVEFQRVNYDYSAK